MCTARSGVYLLGVYLPGGTCQGVYLPGGTCQGVYLPGGVPAQGVYLPRGVYLPGGYLPRGVDLLRGVVPAQVLPLPVNRITDRCKNITLPQASFAGGNKGKSAVWFFSVHWRMAVIFTAFPTGRDFTVFVAGKLWITNWQKCCVHSNKNIVTISAGKLWLS